MGSRPATYTNTNQINLFNNASASHDAASNLTVDPATQATYSWDSRNQLSSVGTISPGLTPTYDALSRRRIAASAGNSTYYLHDGSMVVHSTAGLSTNDMLTT